jgi:long-subunit acyl-CoA synthetase (AMP-forming)
MKLLLKPFSVDDDLITPTQKLKRNVAKEFFKDDVERMYKEGPQKFGKD